MHGLRWLRRSSCGAKATGHLIVSDSEDEFITPLERPMREPELVRALMELAAKFADAQLHMLEMARRIATGNGRWNQRTHNEIDSAIRIGLREIHALLDRLPAGRNPDPTPMPPAEEEP